MYFEKGDIVFKIKNGIMYKNGKPVLCIGNAYYASYAKWHQDPNNPELCIKEAKEDIALMKDFGYNLVRVAAFGDLSFDGKKIKYESPIVDFVTKEISDNDMALAIRLQGYSMNVRNHPDGTAIANTGSSDPYFLNYVFMRDCLSNKAVVEDSVEITKQLAEHFGKLENCAVYFSHNEPATPGGVFGDFNKHNIEAYRKWLVNKGIMTEEEAKDYMPPKEKPKSGESPDEWIRFNMFCNDVMAEYFDTLRKANAEVNSTIDTITNLTHCQFESGSANRAPSYFEFARVSDYLGVDIYNNSKGRNYMVADFVANAAESAAACDGKYAWTLETNCRKHLSADDHERQLMISFGAGHKGVIYYNFRGDSIGCESFWGGMIDNVRNKTPKCAEAKKSIALINRMSDMLVNTNKLRSDMAIYYSKYANLYGDAYEYTPSKENRCLCNIHTIYDDMKTRGITCDLIDNVALEDNLINAKVLIIPMYEWLSEEEKATVDEFAKTHVVFKFYNDSSYLSHAGYVLHENTDLQQFGIKQNVGYCFIPWEGNKNWYYSPKEVIKMTGLDNNIIVKAPDENVGYNTLVGKKEDGTVYYVVSLLSTDSFGDSADGVTITVPKDFGTVTSVKGYNRNGNFTVKFENDYDSATVFVPPVKYGTFVVIESDKEF